MDDSCVGVLIDSLEKGLNTIFLILLPITYYANFFKALLSKDSLRVETFRSTISGIKSFVGTVLLFS